MKIKVIASKPREGQSGIALLIGRKLNAKIDREDGTATVQESEVFAGQIVLNKGEYQIVKPNQP